MVVDATVTSAIWDADCTTPPQPVSASAEPAMSECANAVSRT